MEHASCDGFEIERAAIERDKNFCIQVFGYSAFGYAVSFGSRRNYNLEILITGLLEKKSHLRGGCNSVAIVIGNHNYFVRFAMWFASKQAPSVMPRMQRCSERSLSSPVTA